MSYLSRGQIVALVTIALIFALSAIIFDTITNNKSEKITYLKYDENGNNILLNGSYLEYIELGTNYVDQGIDTKEFYVISYFSNNREVTAIDTSNLGTYKVVYTLPDSKTLTRTVIVSDNESPHISVPAEQTITSAEAVSFDLSTGVVATDNSGEVNLTYDNTLSTIPGNYIINYEATDNSGNKTIRKRLIKVTEGIIFTYNDNTLTINYPSSKDKNYTYKYSLDGGLTFKDTSAKTEIPINEGSVIATVYEDNDYIMSNSYYINQLSQKCKLWFFKKNSVENT